VLALGTSETKKDNIQASSAIAGQGKMPAFTTVNHRQPLLDSGMC
jgi:hypothetical protein